MSDETGSRNATPMANGSLAIHVVTPSSPPEPFSCVYPSGVMVTPHQSEDFRLRACVKKIKGEVDMRRWLNSDAHRRFISFIESMAAKTIGKKSLRSLRDVDSQTKSLMSNISNKNIPNQVNNKTTAEFPDNNPTDMISLECEPNFRHASPQRPGCLVVLDSFTCFDALPSSSAGWELLSALRLMFTWAFEIEPIDQPTRFGNQAFKTWCRRLNDGVTDLLYPVWQASGARLTEFEVLEMEDYFLNAFGSPVRLDFGSGHELSFSMFLYCLFQKGVLEEGKHEAFAVLGIFKGYIDVVHYLQQRYLLEAAGSRGVWGLDDFHFLPFIWGAAQLQNQQLIDPSKITEVDVVQAGAEELLYLDSIKYIFDTKRGAPFSECSPILFDVSGIATWKKIYTGLIRMYEGEVLRKLPIAQHFLFGSILSLD